MEKQTLGQVFVAQHAKCLILKQDAFVQYAGMLFHRYQGKHQVMIIGAKEVRPMRSNRGSLKSGRQ